MYCGSLGGYCGSCHGPPVTIVSLEFLLHALAVKKENQTPEEWKAEMKHQMKPPMISLRLLVVRCEHPTSKLELAMSDFEDDTKKGTRYKCGALVTGVNPCDTLPCETTSPNIIKYV